MSGTLYGIGLGPGDAELMTLKAARLIGAARVVAYPALAGGESFARSIAADLLADGVREIRIDVPMVVDRAPAQAAYDKAADEITAMLETGLDVVVLCAGDPFFYGSFMYLYARLSGRFTVEVVPGVTSMTASAAALGLPLAARNEVLSVIPGPLEDDALKARIATADSLVIMKVGRHLERIRRVIDGLGLLDRAHYIERASLAQEQRMALEDAPQNAPYFSMILITKGTDPWL
ncbi:precorrin-2 C(20)-methyltransferase [Profundibacter sp.]|uniref:precorrin-2 C(20)-methyltransferase n=1 Tax=Profundibacter sp. TaxID=3101071 RepID=UPI003D0FFEA4